MAPRSRTFLKIFITALLILLVDLKTNTHSALGGVVPGQTKRVDGLNPGEVGEEELPKLSHDEEMILHALFGGLGPVILPQESDSKNEADDKPDSEVEVAPNRLVRRVSDERTPPPKPPVPEQIHIAYGDDPSEMVIMWSTPSQRSSEVIYGLAPNDFSLTATGDYSELIDWEDYFLGSPFIHRVRLQNLIPGESYSYKVRTDDQQSKAYTFTTMRDGSDWSPSLLVFGDMGRIGGAPSLRLLRQAVKEKSVDAILHVGDFAYDMHDEGGIVGDDFMNRIQDVAAVLPYMTCPGNHEIAHSFVHYRYRFSMPRYEWPDSFNMWYSFNMGNVHFVSYSTEVYFTNGPVREQIEWLTDDLQKANEERGQRPWIIVFGHRPMYCSNANLDDCTKPNSVVRAGLEDLFYENGVDLIIEAHEHSYERFWPMYRGHVTAKNYRNPVAPVHIISGAAGCNEFDGVCLDPILGPRGKWSAFRSWLPGLYGIGRLDVANNTHLHFEQRLAVNGQVEDEFWLEQNNHGHFPPHIPGVPTKTEP